MGKLCTAKGWFLAFKSILELIRNLCHHPIILINTTVINLLITNLVSNLCQTQNEALVNNVQRHALHPGVHSPASLEACLQKWYWARGYSGWDMTWFLLSGTLGHRQAPINIGSGELRIPINCFSSRGELLASEGTNSQCLLSPLIPACSWDVHRCHNKWGFKELELFSLQVCVRGIATPQKVPISPKGLKSCRSLADYQGWKAAGSAGRSEDQQGSLILLATELKEV